MSASLSTSAAAAISVIAGSASSVLSTTRSNANSGGAVNALSNISSNPALFREIHKNTWLKRLTADGKKITVGPKKSERSWVVFCVHDDCEALLEGYAEPRQAASHNPEWIVSLQETQHISHALIPNSHEFEFVVTLQNEVVRFHAMSWEVMQEWVETLRSKLREMKILSPRENLYTKLPEIRAPLLPTRDPTSPLPATPPVPAALVPGVERVVPQSVLQSMDVISEINTCVNSSIVTTTETTASNSSATTSTQSVSNVSSTISSQTHTSYPPTPALSSMSNTLTQNLINMLSNPITAYSEQLQEADCSHVSNSNDAESLSEPGLFRDFDCDLELNGTSKSNNQTNDSAIEFDNSVRLDVSNFDRLSLCSNEIMEDLIHCDRIIPRPQTSRSHSVGAADNDRRDLANRNAASASLKKCISKNPSNSNNNITELEIKSLPYVQSEPTTIANSSMMHAPSEIKPTSVKDSTTNITIIQVSNSTEKNQYKSAEKTLTNLCTTPDVFQFSQNTETTSSTNTKPEDFYTSNVQINPSNLNSSTIHVGESVRAVNAGTAVGNQYSSPLKKILPQKKQTKKFDCAGRTTIETSNSPAITTPRSHLENHRITTVLVGDQTSVYGTCYNSSEVLSPSLAVANASPTLKKKIILTANSSGITNISVNNADIRICDDVVTIKSESPDNSVKCNIGNVRYEKVFLSSSAPIAVNNDKKNEVLTATNSNPTQPSFSSSMLSKFVTPQLQPEISSSIQTSVVNSSSSPSSPIAIISCSPSTSKKQAAITQQNDNMNRHNLNRHNTQSAPLQQIEVITSNPSSSRSPALQRKRTPLASAATNSSIATPKTPPVPVRSRFLTRGLTEAVITSRPSRRDLCSATPIHKAASITRAENKSTATTSINNNEEATKPTSATSSSIQHSHENTISSRRRSESLEQRRRSSSTSEAQSHKARAANNNELLSSRIVSNTIRMQQPPHPVCLQSTVPVAGPSASKRMTLREQQVMQLRREIMHPGGVRLQLRRKDCIGSIAWVDAFGAVWVAGWKQKEHPVLYNALHIGDQLVSIAGVTIGIAADANKVIRNTNTLFVEVLIRRIPLGRGYAIRREREGQCLGLIRDGNTSTIVDVVPNSLAAKHGLPPKAQSCDGSTLTFWVLTEINGRPLNLFFKENEIRDRLNSVGRDISILVQPADLITKLKKQLKSMRGYKDYLVQ